MKPVNLKQKLYKRVESHYYPAWTHRALIYYPENWMKGRSCWCSCFDPKLFLINYRIVGSVERYLESLTW